MREVRRDAANKSPQKTGNTKMYIDEKRSGESSENHLIAGRIDLAANLMQPDNWFSPGNSDGRSLCPEQALSGMGQHDAYVLATITKAADLIFPAPATYGSHWLSPQRFNDFRGRTLGDVHLVMDVAAEMLRHQ
jgi:hypothetical protein